MRAARNRRTRLSRPLSAELIDKMLDSMATAASPPVMRHSERAALLH